MTNKPNEKQPSHLGLFRNRDFRLLLLGQTISTTGDWLIIGLLIILVSHLSDKAVAIAGVMIAKVLPALLFSPLIGVAVDRVNRKKGMIISDISRGFLIALIPLTKSLILIYLIVFLSEVFSLFYIPARNASIPDLVEREQISAANSLSFMVNQVSMIIGLAFGTTVVLTVNKVLSELPLFNKLVGTYTVIYLDAFSFLISASLVALVTFPSNKFSSKPSGKKSPYSRFTQVIKEVREGREFLGKEPKIRAMMISIALAILGMGTFYTLGVHYSENVLGMGREGVLPLLTLLALGLFGGAMATSFLSSFFSKERLFSLSLLLLGVALTLLASFSYYELALILSIISGFSLGELYVSSYTLFQEHISDKIRGRTFTALEALLKVSLLVSLVFTSGVADLVGKRVFHLGKRVFLINGAQIMLLVGGIVTLGAGVYAFRQVKETRGGESL